MQDTYPGRNFGVVPLFLSSIQIVRENFLVLVGMAFVINLAAWALGAVLSALMGGGTLWLDVVVGPLVPALVILMTADILAKRRIDLRAHAGRIGARLAPIVVLSVVSSVVVVLALLAFIVPGLYVAGLLMSAVPLILFEDARWQALSRSYALSKPYGVPLLGLVALLGLVSVAVLLPVLMVAGGAAPEGAVPILLQGGIVFIGSTLGVLTAVVSLQTYLRLSHLQGGAGISRVFD